MALPFDYGRVGIEMQYPNEIATLATHHLRRLPMAKKKSSGKAKGLDGKACWKGYKLAGTKMKGGKRVDNCVPKKAKKKS